MRTLLIGLMAILLAAGCAEEKKSRGQANTRNTRGGGGTGTGGGGIGAGGTTPTGLNCQKTDWGVIYDTSVSQADWQSRVVAFGQASVYKDFIGTVSNSPTDPSTGISFCGRICDSTPTASEIYIGIWDSNAAAAGSEISINLRGGKTMSVLSGEAAKGFEDNYGYVALVGQSVPGANVIGKVYFKNYGYVDQEGKWQQQGGNETLLGQFQIRSDRLFRCN